MCTIKWLNNIYLILGAIATVCFYFRHFNDLFNKYSFNFRTRTVSLHTDRFCYDRITLTLRHTLTEIDNTTSWQSDRKTNKCVPLPHRFISSERYSLLRFALVIYLHCRLLLLKSLRERFRSLPNLIINKSFWLYKDCFNSTCYCNDVMFSLVYQT